MKRKLLFGAVGLGLALVLISCRFTGNPPTNPTPVSASANNQPTAQVTPAIATLDQSAAGQTDQSLNDLESTLQAEDNGPDAIDSAQLDQTLNDLENSLQGTDVPTLAPTPSDTLDQDLDNLQQTLQALPTP